MIVIVQVQNKIPQLEQFLTYSQAISSFPTNNKSKVQSRQISFNQMSTQLKVSPFYCKVTRSSSLRIEISYPNISNLSYNFQMKLQVFLQKLLPRISYQMVHEQTFVIPKKEVIMQHLQPSKMYKVVISWSKKGSSTANKIKEEKTVFVCSEKMPEEEHDDFEEEVGDEQYGEFVKDNIQGYFNQYYHNDNESSQSQKSSALSIKSNSVSSFQHRSSSTNKKPRPNEKASFCNSQVLMKAIGQSDPFINKKNLQKYIIEGRKSSSMKDYLATKDFQCFNSFNKLHKNETQRRKHVEKTLLVSRAIDMFSEIYSFDREHGVLAQTNGYGKSQQRKGKEFFKNDWFMGPFYSYDANERQMKKKNNTNEQANNQ